METYWFDASPLQASGRRSLRPRLDRLRPGGKLSDGDHEAIGTFARANGLGYEPFLPHRGRELGSLVVHGTGEAAVLGQGSPGLEIANHGLRFMPGDLDGSSRRGYIALRHGLDLPHVFVESRSGDAATPLNVASKALELASMLDWSESGSDGSSLSGFRSRSTWLELHECSAGAPSGDRAARKAARAAARQAAGEAVKAQGFITRVVKGREQEASRLLDPASHRLLSGIAESFDVELCGPWLIALSNYGDVSTLDPDVWAWAFSVASRLVDLAGGWGAAVHDARRSAWYTERQVVRPARLDGVLKGILPTRR